MQIAVIFKGLQFSKYNSSCDDYFIEPHVAINLHYLLLLLLVQIKRVGASRRISSSNSLVFLNNHAM